MNRLAQAMIALTAGGAVAAPVPTPKPRRHGKKKSKPVVALPTDLALPVSDNAAPAAAPVEESPVILDAEVVSVPTGGVSPAQGGDPGEPVPIPEPPPPGTAYIPSDRRLAYRELVALRKLIRAWDRFRSTLAVPGEPFATPMKVLLFLDAMDEIRVVLPTPLPANHGKEVTSILSHPLPLGVIRSFVPSQRLAVARDWAQAAAEFRYQYSTLRNGLRRSVPRRGANRLIRGFVRWFRANPEWILVLVLALLLALGLARSRLR
ncbi:MAG TPA: hypothetical protein VGJ05_16795 [Fimbriiglobus sp.]